MCCTNGQPYHNRLKWATLTIFKHVKLRHSHDTTHGGWQRIAGQKAHTPSAASPERIMRSRLYCFSAERSATSRPFVEFRLTSELRNSPCGWVALTSRGPYAFGQPCFPGCPYATMWTWTSSSLGDCVRDAIDVRKFKSPPQKTMST